MKIELSDRSKQYIQTKIADGTCQSPFEFVESLIDAYRVKEAKPKSHESPREEEHMKNFLEHLHKIGLLQELRHPSKTSENDDCHAVPISGKSLSQTIIEERR